MKRILPLVLVLVLLFTSCGKTPSSAPPDGDTASGSLSVDNGDDTDTSSTPAKVDFAQSDADMFTDRDYEVGYDADKSILIQLNGDAVTCRSDAVKIAGTTVTITDEGTYILAGTLNDGRIVVDAEDTDKPQLVLNGVTITSKTSAPLYIVEADKVFVTLAADTSNALSNGGSFTAVDDNNIDGVVFSKQDLTFNGSGSLVVTSPAGHGIVCKDDLVFTSGTYTINASSHGVDANDSVRVANAAITVDAGKDGIHAENSDDTTLGFVYVSSGTLNIQAEGDGVSAASYMQVEGGNFDVVSGGGSANATKQSSDSWGGFMGGGRPGQMGMSSDADSTDTEDSSTSIKGLKATGSILVSDGSFTIDSADDAVHSNASITVNGGTFAIASGDDGFHADETLTITAGKISITESYEGLEALDIAVSGGDITLVASDDGLNAAGGTDSSGFGGPRGNDGFGGGGMGGGHMGGGGGSSSSSNGSIVISGGKLYVNASGDGLDANGTLTVSGGHTTVCGPMQGDTATLDYDVSGIITGGTFIGTGASGMAQSFSDSEQGVIAVSVGSQAAGTAITLTDANGNTILSHTPELSYQVVILSSPAIVSGDTYTITVGTSSGEFTAS